MNRYRNCGKYLPPAAVCDECGAITGRGDEQYPDNHWEWCSKAGQPGAPGPSADTEDSR